jgi:hypothetical protein
MNGLDKRLGDFVVTLEDIEAMQSIGRIISIMHSPRTLRILVIA